MTINLPDEYLRLVDECGRVAGLGDAYWNERYTSALERRGLVLALRRPPNDRDVWYPHDAPMLAPVPYPVGFHAWPIGSLIVWRRTS